MSAGIRLPFRNALGIAKNLTDDLRPVVQRVKVAGSLRRRSPDVGDIELVIVPRMVPNGDLFFDAPEVPDLGAIRHVATKAWGGKLAKNGDRYIQVVDPLGVAGLKVELFMATAETWGSILAIRTGPAELGKWAVTQMRNFGFAHVEGHAVRLDTGEIVPTPTEEDFFRLAGLRCLPPHLRDTRAAYIVGAAA